jgi:hypothetical protein
MNRTRAVSNAPDSSILVPYSQGLKWLILQGKGQGWGGGGGKMFSHKLHSPSLAHCSDLASIPSVPFSLVRCLHLLDISIVIWVVQSRAPGRRQRCYRGDIVALEDSGEPEPALQDFLLAWLLWGHCHWLLWPLSGHILFSLRLFFMTKSHIPRTSCRTITGPCHRIQGPIQTP